MLIQSRCRRYKSAPWPTTPVLHLVNGQQKLFGIGQEKCGMTTQREENKVWEWVCEIAQSMSIGKKQAGGPGQWDLLLDHCVARISNLVSKRPFWKQYIVENTILDGYKVKAALDEFMDVGLGRGKNMIDETPTKKMKFVHVGMYFITLMRHLLFLMMGRYRRQWGKHLGSLVFTDKVALQRLDRFPFRAIWHDHRLCPSWHCWEESGWKQYSTNLMALAWGWWIDTSDSFIYCWYDHFANRKCSDCWSARPQHQNLRASGLLRWPEWRRRSARLWWYPNSGSQYCCRMGNGDDPLNPPNAYLCHLLWPTSRRHTWRPDAYSWLPQLPSSGWHPPTSSQGYDRQYRGEIGWRWDVASKSEKISSNINRLAIVRMGASKEDYQTPRIPSSVPKLCCWSLCQLPAQCGYWWECGLAMRARSHCESSRCRLFHQ